MSIIWVRHGECGDNVGQPAVALGVSELTEKGSQQAGAFATTLQVPPELLIHSPFTRSCQTAAAILRRFPGLKYEIWPIQEMTILGVKHFENTSWKERSPFSDPYWERCNPDERQGEGAETFVEFIHRVESMMHRALRQPARPLLLISHGHFVRGMVWRTRNWHRPLDQAAMRDFRSWMSSLEVDYLSSWELKWNSETQEPECNSLEEAPSGPNRMGSEA